MYILFHRDKNSTQSHKKNKHKIDKHYKKGISIRLEKGEQNNTFYTSSFITFLLY